MSRYWPPLAAAILITLSPSSSSAQWAGWAAYWENDSYAFWDTSDARYTNGLRFTLVADDTWEWVDVIADAGLRRLFLGDRPGEVENAVVMGQNFFTPNLITTYRPNPEDRPYAGLLYGGARVEFTQSLPEAGTRSRRSQHALELAVGVLGQPALAETFQKTIHVVRENRIPKGWDHQIRTEPFVQLGWDYRTSLRKPIHGRIDADVTPSVGIMAGTMQTLARAGGTVRVGTVPSFPSLVNVYTVADLRDEPEGAFQWAVLAGYEYRAFAHNAVVDGGLRDGRPSIESEHGINEFRIGAMLRKWGWGLDYSRVWRDAEFVTPASLGVGEGNHNFGSFTLSRSLGGTTRTGPTDPWALRDWIAEISMGGGTSWERGPTGNGAGQSGPSIRIGLSKGLTERVLLGFDLSGVGWERGPPDAGGSHLDDFYVVKAWTLGWRPWGRERHFVVRGGVGSAVVKTQRTTIQDFEEIERVYTRDEDRVGAIVGGSYGVPLGSRAAIGLDLTWGDLFDADDFGGAGASYLIWGLGLKWLP